MNNSSYFDLSSNAINFTKKANGIMSHEKKGGKAIVISRDRYIKDYKTYQKSDKGIVNTQKSSKSTRG